MTTTVHIIRTRAIPATDTKPRKITVTSEEFGQITTEWDHAAPDAHEAAVGRLLLGHGIRAYALTKIGQYAAGYSYRVVVPEQSV